MRTSIAKIRDLGGREMLEKRKKRREEPKLKEGGTASAHRLGGQAVVRGGPQGHGGVEGLLTAVHGCSGAGLQHSGGRRGVPAQAVRLVLPALVFDGRLEGCRREEDTSRRLPIKCPSGAFQSSHR